MSVFPFASNPAHSRNIRRAYTERRANELHKHSGVDHMPCLHHAKSSEARLDQLSNEGHRQEQHASYRTNLKQQSKSEPSVAKITKSPSHENIITAFTRPEAWQLTFGSQEGGFKFEALSINSNGNLNNR